MGYKLKRSEVIKLGPNQEKEMCLILEAEERAAIHGVVKFPNNGGPVHGALVKLFKKVGSDPCNLIPVTFAYTDACGQFLFGVCSNQEYVIKVFFYIPEAPVPPCPPPTPCPCDC
jgi:hypothetical protein